jgi:hypothetical protein
MKRNDTSVSGIKEENDGIAPPLAYPYSVENDARITCRPNLFYTDDGPVYIDANVFQDDEENLLAWRRYHALKDEADDTVIESRRLWEDTPFSIFAIQCKLPC